MEREDGDEHEKNHGARCSQLMTMIVAWNRYTDDNYCGLETQVDPTQHELIQSRQLDDFKRGVFSVNT